MDTSDVTGEMRSTASGIREALSVADKVFNDGTDKYVTGWIVLNQPSRYSTIILIMHVSRRHWYCRCWQTAPVRRVFHPDLTDRHFDSRLLALFPLTLLKAWHMSLPQQFHSQIVKSWSFPVWCALCFICMQTEGGIGVNLISCRTSVAGWCVCVCACVCVQYVMCFFVCKWRENSS